MKIDIRIPQAFPQLTVKKVLEDYFLIPRKIRHFLRTKKHVRVNGELINWQSPITAGDLLELTFDQEDYPEKSIPLGQADLVEELYQDEHLIIVNKPEGMKTHGNEPTEIALLNHVSAYVGQICYVVHRLDMETSGAILFAKNPFILPILNRLLEDKVIYRDYLALCQGQLRKTDWTITDKIGRDRHDRRKRVVDNRKGQGALTQVRLLKPLGKNSLVSCRLQTGRTHQIRVHLAHHGHALIGDPLYSRVAAPRLMLHAQKLSLTHPLTLEKISVEARSESFEKVLKKSN
ncbi:TPA: RluA family pseudouridine synthase [Streptococcus suis]|uniref:RluA family pseudouridine synthase n=1 Tax=Streptococcus suis TaxID=1307 RepID=UPI000425C844|nr:RluA family pseudouridine synthase [Streptococcus suis]MBY4956756.1 RluA family pseudouridine synthase [Streptococcus suis]MBY5015268.1 RluA family pseudouridine synthase [Streptococcus suis]MBY5017898.1 RluA family pseudouridine synthase [Streptococcus suis]MBY5022995.1 RluA family pseudouridine synthase [Streptococcus suis]MBY5030114.1 RluA family pseudouridine synthase [Streptococcus suis]